MTNFKFTYTPGEKKKTFGSPKMIPFLRELIILDLPRDTSDIRLLNNSHHSAAESKEIIRRLGGLYDCIADARFNLAAAQLDEYTNFIAIDSDSDSILYISKIFVNNALVWYQAAFDLLIQISWLYFRIYEQFHIGNKSTPKLSFSSANLPLIYQKCTWQRIRENKDSLPQDYWGELSSFANSDTYHKVNDLANALKHRQRINYSEVSVSEQVIVLTPNYNSSDSSIHEDLNNVISILKKYHSDLYHILCKLIDTHPLN